MKEWTNGFSIFKPGQQQKFHGLLRDQALNRIFLAGEHCSVEHGYFEGALETGIRAAANVFQNIDAEFESKFNSLIDDSNSEKQIPKSSLDMIRTSLQHEIQEVVPTRDKKMITLNQFRRRSQEVQRVSKISLKDFRQYQSERHCSNDRHFLSTL